MYDLCVVHLIEPDQLPDSSLKEVNRMLKVDIIEWARSVWASPIFFTPKKKY